MAPDSQRTRSVFGSLIAAGGQYWKCRANHRTAGQTWSSPIGVQIREGSVFDLLEADEFDLVGNLELFGNDDDFPRIWTRSLGFTSLEQEGMVEKEDMAHVTSILRWVSGPYPTR